MRWVTIPEPITPVNPETGVAANKSVTFYEWVDINCLDNPAHFGDGRPGAKAVARLELSFGDADPGESVPLDDADWNRLVRSVNSPGKDRLWRSPRVAAQFVAFMDAIVDAPEDKPSQLREVPDAG